MPDTIGFPSFPRIWPSLGLDMLYGRTMQPVQGWGGQFTAGPGAAERQAYDQYGSMMGGFLGFQPQGMGWPDLSQQRYQTPRPMFDYSSGMIQGPPTATEGGWRYTDPGYGSGGGLRYGGGAADMPAYGGGGMQQGWAGGQQYPSGMQQWSGGGGGFGPVGSGGGGGGGQYGMSGAGAGMAGLGRFGDIMGAGYADVMSDPYLQSIMGAQQRGLGEAYGGMGDLYGGAARTMGGLYGGVAQPAMGAGQGGFASMQRMVSPEFLQVMGDPVLQAQVAARQSGLGERESRDIEALRERYTGLGATSSSPAGRAEGELRGQYGRAMEEIPADIYSQALQQRQAIQAGMGPTAAGMWQSPMMAGAGAQAGMYGAGAGAQGDIMRQMGMLPGQYWDASMQRGQQQAGLLPWATELPFQLQQQWAQMAGLPRQMEQSDIDAQMRFMMWQQQQQYAPLQAATGFMAPGTVTNPSGGMGDWSSIIAAAMGIPGLHW